MVEFAGLIPKTGPAARSKLDAMLAGMARRRAAQLGSHTEPGGKLALGWMLFQEPAGALASLWQDSPHAALLIAGDFLVEGNQSPLEAYAAEGDNFLRKLNGRFCGVLLDRRARKTILFNDRFGLGRIYCHEAADGFCFSSTAKAILAAAPATREIDQRGLAEWVSVGCVLQDRTLFSGISLLPPGSAWTFHEDGRIDKRRYFRPEEWEQLSPLSPAEYQDRLEQVFERVAPRYLRGPQKVAVSLTGGLDSRMILAWLRVSPQSLPCYTFGGPVRDCADLTIARRLAKVSDQPHTTIPIGRDFFRDFAALAEDTMELSDGTMDVIGSVELYVNRIARQIAPIRLTGNYGSEILRANVAFRPGRPDRSLFTPEFGQLLDLAAKTYQSEVTASLLSFIAFKQVPWHHYARFSIEKSQLVPRSPFLDNDLVALAFQVPPEQMTSAIPLLKLIQRGNPRLLTVPTDRALQLGSPGPLARLANEWQEFTAKAEYAYDYGMPRSLVRVDHMFRALHLEKLFLGRHKFYHFRTWYKNELGGFLRERIGGANGSPACYRAGVPAAMVEQHIAGRANHTLGIHKLLSIQLVERFLASCGDFTRPVSEGDIPSAPESAPAAL